MGPNAVAELLAEHELEDALLVVYDQSDGGAEPIDWGDVRNDLTSGEWGRLIEKRTHM